MRIGVLLLPTYEWDKMVELSVRLEDAGYHHLWTFDHVSWQNFRDGPWHAAHPLLAGVGAVTNRVELGTMVSNLNLRHPVLLAKDAMTLDHVSRGRFTIGIGAGGLGFDATVTGQDPLTPGDRVERLTEAVHLLDGLLRLDTTSHVGKFYTADEARMLPGCIQQPRLPIAIAARSPKTIRLAAEFGDAWISNGVRFDPSASEKEATQLVAEQVAMFDEHCLAVGRDPTSVRRIFLAGSDAIRPLKSLSRFGEFIEEYGSLGFTDVVFHYPRADDPRFDYPEELVDQIATTYLN